MSQPSSCKADPFVGAFSPPSPPLRPPRLTAPSIESRTLLCCSRHPIRRWLRCRGRPPSGSPLVVIVGHGRHGIVERDRHGGVHVPEGSQGRGGAPAPHDVLRSSDGAGGSRPIRTRRPQKRRNGVGLGRIPRLSAPTKPRPSSPPLKLALPLASGSPSLRLASITGPGALKC